MQKMVNEELHTLVLEGSVPFGDDDGTIADVVLCSDCGMVHLIFRLGSGDMAGTLSLRSQPAGELGTLLIKCTSARA